MDNSSAGGTVINDCVIHYGHTEIPFGGVNNSGIGKIRWHLGIYRVFESTWRYASKIWDFQNDLSTLHAICR